MQKRDTFAFGLLRNKTKLMKFKSSNETRQLALSFESMVHGRNAGDAASRARGQVKQLPKSGAESGAVSWPALDLSLVWPKPPLNACPGHVIAFQFKVIHSQDPATATDVGNDFDFDFDLDFAFVAAFSFHLCFDSLLSLSLPCKCPAPCPHLPSCAGCTYAKSLHSGLRAE